MPYYLSFFIISLFFVSACSHEATDNTKSTATATSETRTTQSPNKNVLSVRISDASRAYLSIETITAQSANATINAPARIEFRVKAESSVGAIVAGRLNKINVQVGDRVKAGTVLATLDSPEAAQMRADVARTQAELQRAEDKVRRQEMMRTKGLGLEVERVEANIQLKQARTDYARSSQILKMLGDTDNHQSMVLRAPVDGVILRIGAETGSAIETGTMLFELGEPNNLRAVADVFESDLPLIRTGAVASLHIATVNTPLTGRVTSVSGAIQTDLRRASVFIDLDKTDVPIKSGMFAKTTIEAFDAPRVVLPATAVLIKDGKQFVVYVEAKDGSFVSRNVTIGHSHEGMVSILDGINEGAIAKAV
jgi:membrane fusion protein, heavy metal efflux system